MLGEFYSGYTSPLFKIQPFYGILSLEVIGMKATPKNLANLSEEELKNIIALNIAIPYTCPSCQTQTTIPIGKSSCPNCDQPIDCQFD